MSNFNKAFFQPNRSYTRQMAEDKLISLGFTGLSFNGCSYENGASFYFTAENCEKEIRVSDHSLTGRRAFEYKQVNFVEPKMMEYKSKTA